MGANSAVADIPVVTGMVTPTIVVAGLRKVRIAVQVLLQCTCAVNKVLTFSTQICRVFNIPRLYARLDLYTRSLVFG